jgi:hypothetical protein
MLTDTNNSAAAPEPAKSGGVTDPRQNSDGDTPPGLQGDNAPVNGVAIGTSPNVAQQNVTNLNQSKGQVPCVLARPPGRRTPLLGGTYDPHEALELLNSHYLIGKTDQEIGIYRIKDDGSLAFTPAEQFKLDVANIFVTPSGSTKAISAEKFWKESPKRHQRKIVFKPGGTTDPEEFNLWRGFAIEPHKGWQKQRRLLRHIRDVICRGDKAKFKYLMRWLAWAVQNPDKHPGVVIVLKSRKEGTGKSTLGYVMLKIFGPHGALIDDKDRLLGQFNDWIEGMSFVLAEEVLWAGDPKTRDKLKSFITGDTIRIERKFGASRAIPNRMHAVVTTNHEHAVAAGVRDRRFVVLDVSDERVGDNAWFDQLYRDLDDGGINEFLYLLQNLQLGTWHPREILKTAETTEQQRMSADSVSQWAQTCIDADAVVGAGRGEFGQVVSHDLGTRITTTALRDAYTGYCKQNSFRPVSPAGFGKACAEMFGPRIRLPAEQGRDEVVRNDGGVERKKRRPWGYEVPDSDKWQEKLDARLGIKN